MDSHSLIPSPTTPLTAAVRLPSMPTTLSATLLPRPWEMVSRPASPPHHDRHPHPCQRCWDASAACLGAWLLLACAVRADCLPLVGGTEVGSLRLILARRRQRLALLPSLTCPTTSCSSCSTVCARLTASRLQTCLQAGERRAPSTACTPLRWRRCCPARRRRPSATSSGARGWAPVVGFRGMACCSESLSSHRLLWTHRDGWLSSASALSPA